MGTNACENIIIEKEFGNSDDLQERLLERKIFNILAELGLKASDKGFRYLERSIYLTIKDPEVIELITKDLYRRVAREYNTKWTAVERAMRTCILKMGYTSYEENIFPKCNKSGRYTNKEFIRFIARYIVLN